MGGVWYPDRMPNRLPRRPAGVSRMLRAQIASVPSPRSFEQMVDDDDWSALQARVQKLLTGANEEKARRFLDKKLPSLMKRALRDNRMESFHVLLGGLLSPGNPFPAPAQTVSWMLEAAQTNRNVFDFTSQRPQAIKNSFIALWESPQALSSVDWIRHAAQGMPLIGSEHDIDQTEWFGTQWKAFITHPAQRRKLVKALLDSDPQTLTPSPVHRSFRLKGALRELNGEERESFAAYLSDQVLKRLQQTPNPLDVRDWGQWVLELRSQGLALHHPLQGLFAQRLCTQPGIPSNATHQTGAWGLLYRLYQVAPQELAPAGLAEKWTQETARGFGEHLGTALQRQMDRDPDFGTLRGARWQANVQALLNEVCMLERALVAWGIQSVEHQHAYRQGLESRCPAFRAHLQGEPLVFDDPDSRQAWLRVNADLHQEWHTRDRALVLGQALPAPAPTPSRGPRF